MGREALREHMAFIYGRDAAPALTERLWARLQPAGRERASNLSEKDAVLITYGDMVSAPGEAPLQTLADFLGEQVAGTVSGVHILPFYPYTSDDGFSVVDYKAVDPALGDWADVARLRPHFRLMFDAVVNHISASSAWFQGFLRDESRYREYFTVVPPDTDLSATFRPRALPLLTPVDTAAGRKHVWTTFSADQIDLNFANPEVLLEVIDVLLFYVEQGAELIRLDAVGFIWKEIGTPSIHLPRAHRIIQLMRTVLDIVAPEVILITETNVPHADNISYFGDGRNEAQLVYNFSLPPLTLHAFHTGDATVLSRWADSLTTPSAETTFFNFLASHDGIGVTPARGLLPEAAIEALADRVRALGGRVSTKNNPDGSQSAYELNINYLDALGDPDRPDEPVERVARRFLAAQAIMLALRGMPGIYFHSLFGSRGWPEGVAETGRARTINREKLSRAELDAALADQESLRHHVFQGYRRLLMARASSPAFHPAGEQKVVPVHPAVFALWRLAPEAGGRVLALHNVSGEAVAVEIDLAGAPGGPPAAFRGLLEGDRVVVDGRSLRLTLAPHGVRWLAAEG